MYVWMDATVVSKYRSAGGRRWFDGAAGSLDSRRGGSGTREQIGASSWWNDQRQYGLMAAKARAKCSQEMHCLLRPSVTSTKTGIILDFRRSDCFSTKLPQR